MTLRRTATVAVLATLAAVLVAPGGACAAASLPANPYAITQAMELDCTPVAPYRHCVRVGVYVAASTAAIAREVARIDQMPIFFPDFAYRATNETLAFAVGQVYRVTYKPYDANGVYVITAFVPGRQLAGRQLSGALTAFAYDHRFISLPTGGIFSDETVQYTVPFGVLGRLLNAVVVRRRLLGTLLAAHNILKTRAEATP